MWPPVPESFVGGQSWVAETVIVVPCYNEARRLDVDAFLQAVAGGSALRFLFVNDGSTDGTLEVLAELAGRSARISVLSLKLNQGKAEAVRQGMLAAFELDPLYIGYWDADLATPLAEIARFAELLESDPQLLLVMGARVQLLGRDIVRSAKRHYLGRVFATAASLVLRLPVYDTQCGAKLFRLTPATRALFAEPFGSRWIFDVEILARLVTAARRGNGAPPARRVYECPVNAWHDIAGSKVRSRDFVRAAVELYRIQSQYGLSGPWRSSP
jgi:dolichyl-phosphate beta-glucosyltransferase